MRLVLRLSSTRVFQIGIIVLLSVCVIQTTWWIIDNARYTTGVRDVSLSTLRSDIRQAEGLLAAGVAVEHVAPLFPLLVFEGGAPQLRHGIAEHLEAARWQRINRYGWEGSFFMVVLLAGVLLLVRSLRQQHKLQRRQQNFIAAVSHELKSPLASIRLSAETISMRDPPKERRERLVVRILEDVERLGRMITNILQVRKIEEGRLELKAQALLLREVIAGVLDELGPILEERGVEIEQDVPDDLMISADPVAVHSVLRNLIDNACKAVGEGEDRRISVTACRNGRGVAVSVKDRGGGFPPEEAKRLFEKFYRVGDELVRTTPGSGLGLYLSQRLVELDRGTITAHSEGRGQGAEFRVTWLVAEEAS